MPRGARDLTNAEKMSAIAWEAKRLGVSYGEIAQQVDKQGGGDIYRRWIIWRKERDAELAQESKARCKARRVGFVENSH